MTALKFRVLAILCMSLLTLPTAWAQRQLILFHGNGGGVTSWQQYDGFFGGRTGFGGNTNAATNGVFRPTFPPLTTIPQAANSLDLPSAVSNSQQNIAMGSSMGGLVIRELERTGDDDFFGGYITVGTPNGGLPLANKLVDGSVGDYFSDGCEEVVSDPLEATGWLVGGLIAGSALALNINEFGSIVCNTGVDASLTLNPFSNPTTANSLKVGSPDIAALNNFTSTKPRICVWGNENSPVHWRVLQSKLFGNNPSALPINTVGGNQLVDRMNQLQAFEETLSDVTFGIGVTAAVGGVVSAVLYSAPAFYASVQFTEGADWIANSETGWNTLIGSDGNWTTITVTTGTTLLPACADIMYAPDDGDNDYYDSGYGWYYGVLTSAEQQACWQPITVTANVPINGQSDGLVHRETAKIPNVCDIQVLGAGHFELLNHPSATIKYNSIFNGTTTCSATVSNFFMTEQ